MKILALDSSGIVASVAVVEDDTLLAEYTVNYKKTHSQTLLPMLDEIVKMTELELESIDAIAVAAGPGSFWNTLNGKTGFTKEVVNNDGDITNILAITPSSNVALPYMIKLIKSGSKVSDFEDFIEIHPTTDGIFKLTEYFKRYL